MRSVKVGWKVFSVIIWMSLVLSLALWWMTFSVGLLDKMANSTKTILPDVSAARSMLIWEGWFWMVLLFTGGLTLIYFILRDKKQAEQIRGFLATFSHELKTSLAGVSLQSEALHEDLSGSSHEPLALRLVKDTRRLQLQLENTLFLAKDEFEDIYIEQLELQEIVEDISGLWPLVKIKRLGSSNLRSDRRIIESVIKNLVQNAVIHGKATEVTLHLDHLESPGKTKYQLRVENNGSGFKGDLSRLGEFYFRHTPKSGSGVGIFTVKKLLNHLNGDVVFHQGTTGGLSAQINMEANQ